MSFELSTSIRPRRSATNWLSCLADDTSRMQYFEGQLAALRDAMVIDKVPVKSYFGWSFLDNFEWYVKPNSHPFDASSRLRPPFLSFRVLSQGLRSPSPFRLRLRRL